MATATISRLPIRSNDNSPIMWAPSKRERGSLSPGVGQEISPAAGEQMREQVASSRALSAAKQVFNRPLVFLEEKGRKQFAVVKKPTGETFEIRGGNLLKSLKIEAKKQKKTVFVFPSDANVLLVASKTKEIAGKALKKISEVAKEQKKGHFNSEFMKAFAYTSSDVPSMTASAQNAAALAFGFKPDPGVQIGFKILSVLSIPTGALVMMTAAEKLKFAKRIGDIEGMRMAKIELWRGAFEVASGVTIGGIRALGLAGIQTASKTILVWSKALGIASTAVGTVLYSLLAAPFAIEGARSCVMLHELNKVLNDPKYESKEERAKAGFQFLLEKLTLSEEDYKEVFSKKVECKDAEDLYRKVRDPIELSEEEEKLLTEEAKGEIKKRVSDYVKDLKKEKAQYPEVSHWSLVEASLERLFEKECALVSRVKEVRYQKLAGPESFAILKKELQKPVAERLVNQKNITPAQCEKMENTVSLARKELGKKILLYTILVVACLIGIAAMIAGTFFTGGLAPLIVSVIAGLITSAMMIGLDTQSLVEEVKALKRSSNRDLAFLGAIILVSIAAIATGVFFAASPLSMAIILGAGTAMLAMQAIAIAAAWKKHHSDEEVDDALVRRPMMPGPR